MYHRGDKIGDAIPLMEIGDGPSRATLRGFWASSCPRGMNGRPSVMRKRLCVEDDPSAPPSPVRPIGGCHGVCRLYPSLAARLWLQSHSQRQRFLQPRPINTTSTFHRSTVPLKDMQTTLLKHRVGSLCSVKSAWLFQAAACQAARSSWPRPAMCQAPIPYLVQRGA